MIITGYPPILFANVLEYNFIMDFLLLGFMLYYSRIRGTGVKSQVISEKATLTVSVPLLLAIGIVPLIVRLRILPMEGSISDLLPKGNADADFFSFYKSAVLIILSIVLIFSLIHAFYQNKIKLKQPLIYFPLVLLTLSAILSAVFSEYKTVALFGFPGRYEGLLTLLAYLVLFLAADNLLNEPGRIKLLVACLIASSIVLGLIGIFQFARMDVFKTAFAQKIIMPGILENGAGTLKYSNNADNQYTNAIYGTLFNSNTFGMYMSMLFPFSLVLALLVKKRIHLILSLAYSCLMLSCLLGSYSRGAYAGAAIGSLLAVSVLLMKRLTNWKHLLTILLVFSILSAVMIYQSGGIISQRFGSVIHPGDNGQAPAMTDKIRDIRLEDGKLTLFSQFTELYVSIRDNSFSFSDKGGNILDLVQSASEAGTYTFAEPKYKGYTIQVSNNVINIMKDKSFLLFGIDHNRFLPLDSKGRVIKIEPIDSFGFKGMERFASARGYIWSRSIPLLQDTLFIGHGPDTFAMYFPQNDYFGKLNFMYDANILIDKPHNMYLQMAISTGFLSLAAFLFLLLLFFRLSLQAYVKSSLPGGINVYSLLITAAIPGYLAAGLFTDSSVSTAPVFWILLGAGFYLNQQIIMNYSSH
jgi:O-antigen ligase